MTDPPDITIERQSQLLSQLEVLAAERAEVERTLYANRVARQNSANSAFDSLREQELRTHQQTLAKLEQTHARKLAETRLHNQQAVRTLDDEETRFEKTAPAKHQDEMAACLRRRDSGKVRAQDKHDQKLQQLKQHWTQFEQTWKGWESQMQAGLAEARVEARRRRAEWSEAEPPDQAFEKPMDAAIQAIQQAPQPLLDIRARPSAKFFDEGWTVLLLLFATGAAVYPAGRLLGWNSWHWVAAAAGGAALLTLTTRLLCGWRVRGHAGAELPRAAQQLATAKAALAAGWTDATAEAENKRRDLDAALRTELARLETLCGSQRAELAEKHELLCNTQHHEFEGRRRQLEQGYSQQVDQISDKYNPRIRQERQRHVEAMRQMQQTNQAELLRSQTVYDDGMQQLVRRWTGGLADFEQAVSEMNAYCDQRFPTWEQVDWDHWSPAQESARVFPYGRFLVDIDQYGEPPEDPRLRLENGRRSLPAVLAFPQRPSLLLEASDDGKHRAVLAMQAVMLRLLMANPPGKVRFTIIDPAALGQNFSAFMHLSDYDEQIVGPRIWTEQQHIQQQLLDLTEHTENVIQKYLRNEFASIQEYNAQAGEVAEPYRILVVANFPEKFSDEAARRLVSIASTGARCGVFTLISVDTRKKLPREFFLDELEACATTLQWTHNGFRPKDARMRTLPLHIDTPPEEPLFTKAIHVIGKHAQHADRVEVPFSRVAPDDDACWGGDCRAELEVALGQAGANKLQYMRLGRGVAQHVLISGKTGSGKSTLLHALITNLALHYSPEEVEFYLIDFKKGVEFKPYAAHLLPHARVIAIESEREFGMSVLERLDEELRRRGDLFRAAGVQDLKGLRDAHPDDPMPRVLLIIDEFQELFVKDDKIAADASLLLDRLVRQGRAFGMHVLLGSQTLAGGYSLPRSTIGQMAVRIALQCSESDAHLILSEDNTAARLLTRPGEAIYNNANGRFEGNNPFQVVFLSDSERVEQLQRVAGLAQQRGNSMPAPIVFEGNIPADPLRTPELLELVQGRQANALPRAWLGAAVAIKPPTYVDFPRQTGASLLVAGPQEDMALGVLANCAIGLASHAAGATEAPRCYVLDGCRPESPLAGKWERVAAALPQQLRVVSNPNGGAAVLEELVAELDRRETEQLEDAAPWFLVIHNLSRFRQLRPAEDDFSFSSFGQESEAAAESADKLLQRLLRDGPPWGLHVLIWADSFNTVSRWLQRSTLKDLEQRIVFQMTASDSSNLIDSPAASQLGVHRAILYSEETGSREKFRPFAAPSGDWLRTVAEAQRSSLFDS